MKNNNQYIKLKEFLNNEDYKDIKELEKLSVANDKTTLKLELDYKFAGASFEYTSIKQINEFLYYNENILVGYIGICCFDGETIEINGMVHPDFRRQGIFTKLFQLVKEECEKRKGYNILLLSDRSSESGQAFIKATEANYEHSEYEMYLNMDFKSDANKEAIKEVNLRKTNNSDAREIARQNAIYFGNEFDEFDIIIMPEDEEKRGMNIYIAEVNDIIVGKIHLQIENNQGGIFGFGILPEYRRQGYGRKTLLRGIDILKDMGLDKIMLQVATHNDNALNLYKSCGFEVTSIMDYYQL